MANAFLNLPLYAHLPVLIVVISLVYSATRHDQWGAIFVEAFRWGRNMTGFLLSIAAILYVLGVFGSFAALIVLIAFVIISLLFMLAARA